MNEWMNDPPGRKKQFKAIVVHVCKRTVHAGTAALMVWLKLTGMVCKEMLPSVILTQKTNERGNTRFKITRGQSHEYNWFEWKKREKRNKSSSSSWKKILNIVHPGSGCCSGIPRICVASKAYVPTQQVSISNEVAWIVENQKKYDKAFSWAYELQWEQMDN